MKGSLRAILIGMVLVPAALAASCGGGDTGSGGGAQGGGGSSATLSTSTAQSSSSTGGLGGFNATGGGTNAGGATGGASQGGASQGGASQGGGGPGGAGGVGTGGGGGMPMPCQDGIQDGNETDIDCGGGTCPTCALGMHCMTGTDCMTGHCIGGTCAAPPSCNDGIRNGTETGIDCGGGACPKCPNGVACNDGTDCQSGSCSDGTCVAPTCTDGIKNASETDVDCGGGVCSPCNLGQTCLLNGDCTSGHCAGGACVACVLDGDCSGTTDDCQHPACNSHACSTAFTMAGTPVMQQTQGDCHVTVCDGMGGTSQQVDDMDAPSDGNACTADICTNGAASHPPASVGAPCSQGGSICDGTGACVDLRVMVVRVGDGTAPSTTSAPVVLEEWPFSGAEVRTINLPTAASGNNQAFSLAGNGTSEGELALSVDGHFVTVAGYATAPGTATIASSSAMTVQRVVARVDAAGNVDTSTTLGTSAYSGGPPRGVVSVDGTSFWLNGNAGSAANSGIQYAAALGANAATTRITTTIANGRWINIFAGQLFGDSGSNMFTNVFSIGTGEPTTAGQTVTVFPGMLTTGASPYGFALLDRSAAVAGLDTLYIGEDNALSNMVSPGGVQRWTFDGTNWTRTAVFNGGLASGVRGVTATVIGSSVVVIAATAETPSRLVAFIDDGVVTSGTATVIATSPANEFYRGVALSPR